MGAIKDRSGWTRAGEGPKYLRGRTYKHLIEFQRGCAICGEPFSIWVTAKIANGEADSNNFGLRNCPDHRRSRSNVQSAMTATVVRDELAGLYESEKELRAENRRLKEQLEAKNNLPKFPWGS